jgi:hypothetical protein
VCKAGSILAPAALLSAGKSNTFQVDSTFSLPSSSATTSEIAHFEILLGILLSVIYTNCKETRKKEIVYINLSCVVSHVAVRCLLAVEGGGDIVGEARPGFTSR